MSTLFWHLTDGGITRGLAETDQVTYKQYVGQYGDMQPWIPMQRIPNVPQPVLLGGSSVKDFTWTWYGQCLIQDRVLHMFTEQGFTGFQVHPVSAKWKRAPTRKHNKSESTEISGIPTLWELIPVGWGGVAPEESGVRLIGIPENEELHYSVYTDASKLIDEKQWDGSDFFIVWPLPAYIFVSDRVAEFIRKQGLKGAHLIRYDTLRWNPMVIPGFSPGRLRQWLPDERAHEIGDMLGIY